MRKRAKIRKIPRRKASQDVLVGMRRRIYGTLYFLFMLLARIGEAKVRERDLSAKIKGGKYT